VCAHAVRVSLMSVSGVEAVQVNLDKGLAAVKLKPGNTVTLKQLQAAITRNGFTMKESSIVAAGKVVQATGGAKFQITGSNDVLSLAPESPSVTASPAASSATFLLEGIVPETAKGKVPDSVRYRLLKEQK
jgi:copper chaperone CopZ